MTLSPQSPLTLIGRIEARLSSRLDQIGADVPSTPHIYGVLHVTPDAQAALQTPCIVVMILRETAAPNLIPDPDQGGVVQRVTSEIAVTHGVRASDYRGGASQQAEDRLMALAEATRAVLLAWAPDGPFPVSPADRLDDDDSPPPVRGRWAPLELRAGRLAGLDEHKRAWWEDRYETHRLVHGEPAPARPLPGRVPSTVYSGLRDAGASPAGRHVRLTGDVAC